MIDKLDPGGVDPQQLIDALLRTGHRVAGVGRGYTRLARPGEKPPRGSLRIPTDRTAGDYLDLMAAVVGDLEDTAQRGAAAAAVLAQLGAIVSPDFDAFAGGATDVHARCAQSGTPDYFALLDRFHGKAGR